MGRRIGLLVFSFCSLAALATTVSAQLNIVPGSGAIDAYDLTIINRLGYDARIKFVGFLDSAYFTCDLGNNQSAERDFFAGDRVMCVWDESGTLRMSATINVNRNGILELRDSPTSPLPTTYTIQPK